MHEPPTGVLNVVSYNIHKGFSSGNRRLSLRHMRDALRALDPDLVLVQEVVGANLGPDNGHPREFLDAQFEYLADEVWTYHAYGRNAVHAGGDHGNAILSRYPIGDWENIDISQHRLEQRGILHAEVSVPGAGAPLHVCCTHLNLLHRHRKLQVAALARRIHDMVPDGSPLIIGGDFNDWRTWVTGALGRAIGVRDAHLNVRGHHARTFPAWQPVLALDRIYVRDLDILDARVLDAAAWRSLSDHLGLQATVRLRGQRAEQ